MPNIEIKQVQCNYTVSGQGKDIILLHGWGQNIEMMEFIQKHLQESFRVFNIDFPGFGKSETPAIAWGVHEYADFLFEFVEKQQIENPILIGHSFGCRVAIRYAVNHPIYKMVFTGAAGLRSKPSNTSSLKTSTFKIAKKMVKMTGSKELEEKLKNKFGSEDYKNAHGVMRDAFVKIVNDDLTDCLDKFDCPVLLVWGEYDEATPLWMGKVMEEKMKNAGLAIFENDDHYAYFHQSNRFCLVLDAFFKEDKVI